jgi:hypothetical protein
VTKSAINLNVGSLDGMSARFVAAWKSASAAASLLATT